MSSLTNKNSKPNDNNSTRITEEDLIAYQMGECSRLRAWQIKRELEKDPLLAEEAASIASTLRAFSADPAPMVDASLQERMWQNIRPSLLVLEPKRSASAGRVWMVGLGSALAGAALVLMLITRVHVVREHHPGAPDVAMQTPAVVGQETVAPEVETAQREIASIRPELPLHNASDKPQYYHGKPGPITVDSEDSLVNAGGLAAHLDLAERVLTEVSHEEGPMPAVTRHEVHRLLLENALYQEHARSQGDYSAASVMDDLGRALTSLDADPPKTASSLDAFRLEFNVGGVLFDLRVLHDDRAHNPQ